MVVTVADSDEEHKSPVKNHGNGSNVSSSTHRGNGHNNNTVIRNNLNNTRGSSNNRDVKPEIYGSQKKRLLAKAASEWNPGMKQEPGMSEAPLLICDPDLARNNINNNQICNAGR